MQIIEDNLIKEKVYIEKLENGMTLMCIPKKKTVKKYISCAINYGSVDNKFKVDEKIIEVPEGVAHYLEHKLFEQENGNNSLDVLSSLGVNANAYTTNDHTAYLYECTDNFYEALDEFLNYIQNPYFTDENVEKEKGIIRQEIQMYEDEPDWQVYMNALRAMYKNHPIRIDIAGTVDSILKIDKDILYECYNNFYIPENMVIVVSGDFEPEEIFKIIKSKLKNQKLVMKAKKIEIQEPKEINKKIIEEEMDIVVPTFIIGFKDKNIGKEKVKRHLAIEILLELIVGGSSKLYKKLYEEGLIYSPFSTSYEFSRDYAHALIQGQSRDEKEVIKSIQEEINQIIEIGIENEEFERIKRKLYGLYVRDFDSVQNVTTTFVTNYFKGINPFEYLEDYLTLSKEYVENVAKEIFDSKNMIMSIITPKK